MLELSTSRILIAVVMLISLVAWVLCTVGLATSHWIDFTSPSSVNPAVNVPGTNVNYFVRNYGPFAVCIQAVNSPSTTCATIKWNCDFNLCALPSGSGGSGSGVCLSQPVRPIGDNCEAFNATRIIVCIGGFFAMLAFIAYLAGFKRASRVTLGAISSILAFVFIMIPFALFYAVLYKDTGASEVGSYGYSFALIIASFPIALVAGILGFVARKLMFNNEAPREKYPPYAEAEPIPADSYTP